jgi:hypothetical protein
MKSSGSLKREVTLWIALVIAAFAVVLVLVYAALNGQFPVKPPQPEIPASGA